MKFRCQITSAVFAVPSKVFSDPVPGEAKGSNDPAHSRYEVDEASLCTPQLVRRKGLLAAARSVEQTLGPVWTSGFHAKTRLGRKVAGAG